MFGSVCASVCALACNKWFCPGYEKRERILWHLASASQAHRSGHADRGVCNAVTGVCDCTGWTGLYCEEQGNDISRGRERFACAAVGVDHVRYAPHVFPVRAPRVSRRLDRWSGSLVD